MNLDAQLGLARGFKEVLGQSQRPARPYAGKGSPTLFGGLLVCLDGCLLELLSTAIMLLSLRHLWRRGNLLHSSVFTD